MTPGSTRGPLASRTSSARVASRVPMSAMRSPATATSTSASSEGVKTCPPLMRRSQFLAMAFTLSCQPALRRGAPLAQQAVEEFQIAPHRDRLDEALFVGRPPALRQALRRLRLLDPARSELQSLMRTSYAVFCLT